MACGNNVQERDLLDEIGVIEGQPMRRPCAAIMTGKKKPIVSEGQHDVDLILGHRAK